MAALLVVCIVGRRGPHGALVTSSTDEMATSSSALVPSSGSKAGRVEGDALLKAIQAMNPLWILKLPRRAFRIPGSPCYFRLSQSTNLGRTDIPLWQLQYAANDSCGYNYNATVPALTSVNWRAFGLSRVSRVAMLLPRTLTNEWTHRSQTQAPRSFDAPAVPPPSAPLTVTSQSQSFNL